MAPIGWRAWFLCLNRTMARVSFIVFDASRNEKVIALRIRILFKQDHEGLSNDGLLVET